MLRFWVTVSLRLLIIFTGIGLMLSRQWGWREYASDELYVVYTVDAGIPSYYLTNVDAVPGEEEPLTLDEGEITALDCSPDGRTLAFLTDSAHVGVVTRAGMVEKRAEYPGFDQISVANNGTVALFNSGTGDLRVGSFTTNLSTPTHQTDGDSIDISSQGFVLWNQGDGGTELFSPVTGEQRMFLPFAYGGQWLASENIFAFNYGVFSDTDPEIRSGWYLADASTHETVRIREWSISNPVSPDGLLAADGVVVDGLQQENQVAVFNALDAQTASQVRVLTSSADVSHWPLCFLTFRPQMLIAGN